MEAGVVPTCRSWTKECTFLHAKWSPRALAKAKAWPCAAWSMGESQAGSWDRGEGGIYKEW
jgi:hypothetical protein